jgi:hypothetical protein
MQKDNRMMTAVPAKARKFFRSASVRMLYLPFKSFYQILFVLPNTQDPEIP